MSQNSLFNSSFHSLLITVDRDLASTILQQGCLYCQGKLHQADYSRSPVGVSPPLRPYYEERISFCCENCCKRITPPSIRFFGRRWYPAPFHLRLSALMLGIKERRLSQVRQYFGSLSANRPESADVDSGIRHFHRRAFGNTPSLRQKKHPHAFC